jgi:Co/Zn/Cd efflux system component
MKKFKQVLAFTTALLVLFIGMISNVIYLTHNDSLNQIIGLILSSIVFFPAFSFWYETAKELLKVKDDEK